MASALQTLNQHPGISRPVYTEKLPREGPVHKPIFKIICEVKVLNTGAVLQGSGSGSSIKQAKNKAAEIVLPLVQQQLTSSTGSKTDNSIAPQVVQDIKQVAVPTAVRATNYYESRFKASPTAIPPPKRSRWDIAETASSEPKTLQAAKPDPSSVKIPKTNTNMNSDPLSVLNNLRYRPEFKLISREGPSHCPVFNVDCTVFDSKTNKHLQARGQGGSMKIAKKAAASEILLQMGVHQPMSTSSTTTSGIVTSKTIESSNSVNNSSNSQVFIQLQEMVNKYFKPQESSKNLASNAWVVSFTVSGHTFEGVGVSKKTARESAAKKAAHKLEEWLRGGVHSTNNDMENGSTGEDNIQMASKRSRHSIESAFTSRNSPSRMYEKGINSPYPGPNIPSQPKQEKDTGIIVSYTKKLYELAQKYFRIEYRTVPGMGAYGIQVMVGQTGFPVGTGSNLQDAKVSAANNAIDELVKKHKHEEDIAGTIIKYKQYADTEKYAKCVRRYVLSGDQTSLEEAFKWFSLYQKSEIFAKKDARHSLDPPTYSVLLLALVRNGQLTRATTVSQSMLKERNGYQISLKEFVKILQALPWFTAAFQQADVLRFFDFCCPLSRVVKYADAASAAYFTKMARLLLQETCAMAKQLGMYIGNVKPTADNLRINSASKEKSYIWFTSRYALHNLDPDPLDYNSIAPEFIVNIGDAVLIRRDISQATATDNTYEDAYQGVLESVSAEKTRLKIKITFYGKSDPFTNGKNGDMKWRIDKLNWNQVTFIRQLEALRILLEPPTNVQSQSPASSLPKTPLVTTPAKFSTADAFRQILTAGFKDSKYADPVPESVSETGSETYMPTENELQALKASSMFPEDVQSVEAGKVPDLCADSNGWDVQRLLDSVSAEFKLNLSQQQAVKGVLNRRLSLVQGPPGTGKTHTAVAIVKAFVLMRRGPILCTSDSNTAVDNLLDGLAKVGLNVVRIGKPDMVRKDLAKYHVRKLTREKQQSRNVSSILSNEDAKKNPKHELYESDLHTIRTADAVCCTCSVAGSDILNRIAFSTVLLDEASQLTELMAIIPLIRGCQQLALIGDHKQLPPTVVSEEAKTGGLAVSLFDRLISLGVQPFLLDEQFRMHPALGKFPSDAFYDGRVRNGTPCSERPCPQGFPWPHDNSIPVCFLPSSNGSQETRGYGGYLNSYANQEEAQVVVDCVTKLLNGKEVKESDIGVVTPYAAQVQLVRSMLRKNGIMTGVNRRTLAQGVEVSSVDGFQGREKEVIIVSTVRANFYGNLGFVSDPRRCNVTLTRGKRGLIVTGHVKTLKSCNHIWGPWVDWAFSSGLVVTPDLINGRINSEKNQGYSNYPSNIEWVEIIKKIDVGFHGPRIPFPNALPDQFPATSTSSLELDDQQRFSNGTSIIRTTAYDQQQSLPQGQPFSTGTATGTTAQTQQPSLPQGWSKGLDPATGREYYFNPTLNITQWEYPSTCAWDNN